MTKTEIEKKILAAAQSSLQKNIQTLNGRKYLSAGGHHFRTLWTRDFCHSAKGLLALNHHDVVSDHLRLLEGLARHDGLVPRVVDSLSPRWRVLFSSAAKVLTFLPDPLPIRESLKPEYVDEHGTEAMDSNLLFLLACLDSNIDVDLKKPLLYYGPKFDRQDGLLVQPAFSDWQDSVRREGKSLYINLLWWRVLEKIPQEITPQDYPDADAVRLAIQKKFFQSQTGLYLSLLGQPHISLESMLFMLDWKFCEGPEAQKLYQSLKASPFYSNPLRLPGFSTFPSYPKSWQSLAVRIAGLGEYHASIYWTWLMSLSAKVAKKMQDPELYHQLLVALSRHLSSEGDFYEILDPQQNLRPWKSFLYHSEFPFSWGAAMAADAILTKEL